ncbi:hypothetical protein, partial [Aphanothece hegewaldii]|uniref:hypothetical protein n=1 Tax=Aphanothece hegewaldii TaxID=1521625 RepID=UPI001FE83898
MSRSDRILHPVAAFWLPFAYKHCSNASPPEVQQIARSAVYQLKLHIQYLEDSFGLSSHSVLSTKDQEFSSSGKENFEPFLDVEDFSEEDDILSQFTQGVMNSKIKYIYEVEGFIGRKRSEL